MLGRLGMRIDECLKAYEELSRGIFGKHPGKMRKWASGAFGMKWYSTTDLQNAIRRVLDQRAKEKDSLLHGQRTDTMFCDEKHPGGCKVMLCVTRKVTNSPELLRSYITTSATQDNYPCRIWEAGSATAAAPFYFRPVKFETTGEMWSDGGMHRNNPVFEVLNEARRIYGARRIACLLSLGCAVGDLRKASNSIIGFAKGAIDMMTDAEATRRTFDGSYDGKILGQQGSYFFFNVTGGAAKIKTSDWDTMHLKKLADLYMGQQKTRRDIERCRERLLDPDKDPEIPAIGPQPPTGPRPPPEPDTFGLLRSYGKDPDQLIRNVEREVEELTQVCEDFEATAVKDMLGAMATILEFAQGLNVYIFEPTNQDRARVSTDGNFIQPIEIPMLLHRENQTWIMSYLPKAGLGQEKWHVVHTGGITSKLSFENQIARGRFSLQPRNMISSDVWLWTFTQENHPN